MSKKDRNSKRKGTNLPFLFSPYESTESLYDYVEKNGGFTSNLDPEASLALQEQAQPAQVQAEHKDIPTPPLNAEDSVASTFTTKTEYSSKKLGTEPLARIILDTVPIRNIGGTLWVRKDAPVYSPMSRADVISILRDVGKLSRTDTRLKQRAEDILECLRSIPKIYLPELPVPKGRILFQNVCFDAATFKAISPSEDDILIHRVNADLPRSQVDTPVWDAFLDSVSGSDASIQARIRAMLGYLMLPEQDAKAFFVLGTAPDSGKSVLGHFLQKLFGAENTSAVSLHNLRSEFAMAPILGKKLNLSMDLPGDSLKDSAVGNIKTMTGDDLVSINIKYEPHVQQRVTAKFVFGTNSPLLLEKPDSAFWRRLVLIPFMTSISKEKQDKDLLKKLWAERDGIVRQGVIAAHKLIENNYAFPQCKYADHIVHKWSQTEGHHVLDFVHDRCLLGDLSWYAGSSELYLAYRRYCEGKDVSPVSLAKFSRILSDHADSLNIRKHHRNDGWGFKGIAENPNL